jgi:hypothetical protein
MRLFNAKAALFTGCLILVLFVLAPPFTQGDEWNLATKFRISHAFEVPGLVLQPNTPYVIRLYDSPAERHVVQIYNEDQTEMLTMFFGVSTHRLEPADETVFTFVEVEPNHPLPIKEWFYPGRQRGLEFVYPKDRAMEIARHAREPILASEVDGIHELDAFEVEAIGPIQDVEPVTETAANVTEPEPEVESTEVSEPDPAVEPEIAQAEEAIEIEPAAEPEVADVEEQPEESAPAPIAEEAEESEELQELPATAGELPMFALIGLLLLGAGMGLRVYSAKS